MKAFGRECFPKMIKPQYRSCSFHDEVDRWMHYGFTQSKGAHDAKFGFFGHRHISKSTKVLINSIYATAYNLKKFIVHRADSLQKSRDIFLARFKLCLSSEMFLFVFGNLRPEKFMIKDGLKDVEGLIITQNEVRTKALSVGMEQSVRSLIYDDTRIDLLLEDDIENDENTKSDMSIRYIHNKLKSEDVPALDIVRGMLVFTQTPIVRGGVYQWVLTSPGFRTIERPLYKKDQNGNRIVDADGNPVPEWPELFPPKVCKAIEADLSSSAEDRRLFAREYLLEINASEDRTIPPENIHFCICKHKYESGRNWVQITEFDGDPVKNPKWEVANITFALDPATSEDGKACDSVGIFVATLSGQRRIVLDMFFGKMRARDVVKFEAVSKLGVYDIETDYNKIEKKGVVGEMYRRCFVWTPDLAAIETVTEYENTLREIQYSYDHWYTKKTKHRMEFSGYKPKGEKRDRIFNQIEPDFSSHRVMFSGERRDIRNDNGKIIEQIIPFKPLYDQVVGLGEGGKVDMIDALHIAFRFSETPEERSEDAAREEVEDVFTGNVSWITTMHGVV